MRPHEQLEAELAKWITECGLTVSPEQVVACSSGTAALHLAFEALQLPQGSEVVMSDFNMIACPRAVSLAGLKPVFVDCGDDLLLDTSKVAKHFGGSTKSILQTWIYGRVDENDRQYISGITRQCGVSVVEDMAEVHGVAPHEDTDAACWSFYKNKIVAGEEGARSTSRIGNTLPLPVNYGA